MIFPVFRVCVCVCECVYLRACLSIFLAVYNEIQCTHDTVAIDTNKTRQGRWPSGQTIHVAHEGEVRCALPGTRVFLNGVYAVGDAGGFGVLSHGNFTGRLNACCTNSMPCSLSVSIMTLTLPAYFIPLRSHVICCCPASRARRTSSPAVALAATLSDVFFSVSLNCFSSVLADRKT